MTGADDPVLTAWPEPAILTVTLNRPSLANAFNTAMAERLVSIFEGEARASETRCVILTGAGDRAFCAGADLKERNGMAEVDWRTQHVLFERMAYAIMDCPTPVIAAVNGAAYAGGFELALAADFAYAVPQARFALTEVTLGLIPGIGGTQNLPRAVGLRKAKEILLTGQPISAAKAYEIGVVNRLCPPEALMPDALDTARRIAEAAPLAVRAALQAMEDGADRPLPDARDREVAIYNTLIDTEDRKEGVAAFNEKRKPIFKGL